MLRLWVSVCVCVGGGGGGRGDCIDLVGECGRVCVCVGGVIVLI